MPSLTLVLEPATSTSSTAGTHGKNHEPESVEDIKALLVSLKKDVAALRAVQTAANGQIVYLRMNTDRIVRDAGTEIRRMRKHLKLAQIQIKQMDEVQKHLFRKLRQYEGSPTPTEPGTPAPPNLRRLSLRRQGAFSGPLEEISWVELNDVRGFDPKAPRYHDRNADLPPTVQKRPREEDATTSPSTTAWAAKRRRLCTPARAPGPSPPSAPSGFIASIFSM
ncbi:hypothetical protein HWV62_27083 [Athelia sp. TMB]|nr:hypothetical protein HWV62_40364 [Athelia sp. TMB]KAF7982644.1 hypothetical protein HWV62_27083 [Athelia sp. TMB]